MNGARRAMRRRSAGEVPLQVQVTMELTGRMLPGTEIAAALAAIDPLQPDVVRHQLRHRARWRWASTCATSPPTPACRSRASPTPACPSVVDGDDALRPHPRPARRAPRPLRHRARRERHRRLLRHDPRRTSPRSSTAAATSRSPRAARPTRPGATSIYSLVPFEQDTSFLIIGERTNANGSKKFREAHARRRPRHLRADGQGPGEGGRPRPRRLRRLRRAATAPPTWTSSPSCSPPRPACPLVLDSTEAPVLEAGLQWLGGRAILNSANLEDGEGQGSRFDKVMRLAKEYGAAVICLLIDEEGQARDVEWKLRVAHRIHDLAVDRYGLEPSDLIFDALTFPLSTGDDDLRERRHRHHRGHPPHQGRAARRLHHPRRLQRLVRPQAGRPPRPQLGVPPRVRRGRPRLRHRPRRPASCRSTGSPTSSARSALDLVYDRRRARLRPAHRAARRVRRRADRRGRAGGPQRLDRRAAASASASSTATARVSRPTSTRPWPTASRRWPSSTTCCSPA